MTENKSCETIEVTEHQKAFLDYCQELGYGKIEVVIRDGEPVYGTQVKIDVKF